MGNGGGGISLPARSGESRECGFAGDQNSGGIKEDGRGPGRGLLPDGGSGPGGRRLDSGGKQ